MSEPVYGVVYALTSPSGKQYVGQTVQTPKRRFIGHKSCAKRLPKLLISKAINKYGAGSFVIEEVAVAKDAHELDSKEEYWIKTLDTMSPRGYNTRDVKKQQFTEDVRRKISKSKMGHEVSQETRDKIRESVNASNRNRGIKIKHGTTTGYSWYGCRCNLCKTARSEYRKAHWRKHRR